MRIATLSLAAAIALNAHGGPAKASVFDPETFTLDNGMQVVVVTNRRAPVVSHWVWYKVGSADSPLGQSGIAHFLEHLMFKGTETLEPGEFSRTIARNGGQDNAMTGPDFTAYFQNIARDRLEMVMRMEADRMVNLRLTEAEVLPERDVVLEERASRVDNDPGARLGEMINAAQFLHHPYGIPIIGWRNEMEAYSREDALAFYEQHYGPDNAIAIIVGDVSLDEVRPLAEEIYGSIDSRAILPRARVMEPEQVAERRVTLRDERVRQPSISRSYLAPSYTSGASEHAHALEVFAELFGSGSSSTLYRALVVEQGLAVSAGAYYRASSLDLSTLRIYASPRDGVSMASLEAAIDAEIAKVLKEGVDPADVERVKERMQAEAIYARDSLSTAARVIGTALVNGRTLDDVEGWPDAIAAVSADDVDDAARAVLKPETSVTGLLLSKDTTGQES